MNVRYLEAAQAEFDEAFEWYELQHPGLGYEFVQHVVLSAGMLHGSCVGLC